MLRLSRILLQKELGNLVPEVLSFHLLQQDPYASFLTKEKIQSLIHLSLETAQKWAKPYENRLSLPILANRLTKEGVQILLRDQKEEQPNVRAEYDRKQKRITIYRNSFSQLNNFLRQQGYEIEEEEWILLHLTHEFFHHLESKPINRKTFPVPRVTFRKIGPLRFRRPLWVVREIAAHAFTKNALSLPWSPYLLDLWIKYQEEGRDGSEIRDAISQIQKTYETFFLPIEP